MIVARVSSVSNLLPNLDDLLTELPGATPGVADARALAQAASSASTVDELDQALTSLAADWRKS